MANHKAKRVLAAAALSLALTAGAKADVVFSPGVVLGFNVPLDNGTNAQVTGALAYDGNINGVVTNANVSVNVGGATAPTYNYYNAVNQSSQGGALTLGNFTFNNNATVAVYAGIGANTGATIISLTETVLVGNVFAQNGNTPTATLSVIYNIYLAVRGHLTWGGNSIDASINRLLSAYNGYEAVAQLTALSDGSVTTVATLDNSIDGSGDPTLAVPEPVSMALVGIGLAGLAAARRRRG